MAGSLGSLSVDVTANLANINRGFDRLERRLTGLGTNMRRSQNATSSSTIAMGNAWFKLGEVAVKAMAKMMASIGKLIKESSKIAISYENTMAQVGTIFGNASNIVKDFAENQAINMGISTSAAASLTTSYGILISTFAKTKTEAAKMSVALAKQSKVIAAATGRTIEDVENRIKSGLTGTVTAIDNLGIQARAGVLKTTKAFKRFAGDKSWNQLDFKVKQQIIYWGIMEQSLKTHGTTVKNTTSAALSELSARLDEASLKLGQAFLPLIQKIIPVLIDFAKVLVDLAEGMKAFSHVIFGVKKQEDKLTDSGDDAANSQDDLSDNIDKAAKSARKSLAPFDKLNNLQEQIAKTPTTTGGGDGAGGTGGTGGTGDGSGIFGPPASDADIRRTAIVRFFTDTAAGAKGFTTAIKNAGKAWDTFNKPIKAGEGFFDSLKTQTGEAVNDLFGIRNGLGLVETQTTQSLNSMNIKVDTFFSGLQQKPWSDVKMNWFTGMQNIKNTMDIVLSRMDKNVDSHIEGIKNKDWTGVQTEWDNSWGNIRTDIDTQLGNIETDVQDTVFNIQKEVEKAKMALASITGSSFGGVPINRNSPAPIRLDPSSNDINTDFLGSGNVGTDTASNLTQVQGNNLPPAPVEVKVNLDGREIAKGIFDPLQKESERRGSSVITRQNPSPFLK